MGSWHNLFSLHFKIIFRKPLRRDDSSKNDNKFVRNVR